MLNATGKNTGKQAPLPQGKMSKTSCVMACKRKLAKKQKGKERQREKGGGYLVKTESQRTCEEEDEDNEGI